MNEQKFLYVDGRKITFNGERNLLEVIRKANIEIPTFCYHSELSVYGACRMCLVEVEGRGLQSSCSVLPEHGIKIKTSTEEIRDIRKIAIELLLANHDHNCPTCPKSNACKLQDIAFRLGVKQVRFKRTQTYSNIDFSSFALVRDPNKCILCGDCVRACEEIQGIGAIDFAHRGSNVQVLPAFGKNLADVECVDCGQCARVCPTGSITPKSEIDEVFHHLGNPELVVVAQLAPAVRVAIGELFGMKKGEILTGQIVAALKMLGFNAVYDTSFAADLTVIEEANEFLKRKSENANLPLFTSCCPAWVKFAEQYFPEDTKHLSSCKSPQQMFGSVAKELLPKQFSIPPENIKVISIMPCTAKKFEARRNEFIHSGIPDVDNVITTQELALMIKQAGIKFENLTPESFDLPLGFKTGAGVIFGASGGVSEAVLRYVFEKVNGYTLTNVDFAEVRGEASLRELEIMLGGQPVRMAIVNGLKNAKQLMRDIKSGKKQFDLVEVMACPGGCVGGAGQPVHFDSDIRNERTKGIFAADKMLQLHKSQENPYVSHLYSTLLGEPGSEKSHHMLHTHFQNRKRIEDDGFELHSGDADKKLQINVCIGTSCYLKGSQRILHKLIQHIEKNDLKENVDVAATFCMEHCDKGPTVRIGGTVITKCDYETAKTVLQSELKKEEINQA